MENFKHYRTLKEFIQTKFPDNQDILAQNARSDGNIIFNLIFYRFQTKGYMDVIIDHVNDDPKTFFEVIQEKNVFSELDKTFIKTLQEALQHYEKERKQALVIFFSLNIFI